MYMSSSPSAPHLCCKSWGREALTMLRRKLTSNSVGQRQTPVEELQLQSAAGVILGVQHP